MRFLLKLVPSYPDHWNNIISHACLAGLNKIICRRGGESESLCARFEQLTADGDMI